MDKLFKLIVFVIAVVIAIKLDEYVVFPAIFQTSPFPLDWLFVIVVSLGELLLLLKGADVLFGE